MVKYVHIFPEPEKKWNRGDHNVPEMGGQAEKFPENDVDIVWKSP